jgi:VIT1/CCC1 family predicted Fe2+/Mn2+ transporter
VEWDSLGKTQQEMKNQKIEIYFRNFVFGVEDSLVSTVGLLSGVAVAGVEESTIFLTGVVLILVEAFSMGVGSFVSEESVEELQTKKEVSPANSLLASLVMFFSYVIAGLIPLFPYTFFTLNIAFPSSIILSIVSLFILGVIRAQVVGLNILKHGIKMAAIGGMAIIAGVLVGKFVGK